jgi:hypothetical protein
MLIRNVIWEIILRDFWDAILRAVPGLPYTIRPDLFYRVAFSVSS